MRTQLLSIKVPNITCIVPVKRYFDVDTGKYNLDKMSTIRSYSIGDILEDFDNLKIGYHDARHHNRRTFFLSEDIDDELTHIRNMPKFEPKDNDFDNEVDEIEVKAREAIEDFNERARRSYGECYIIKNNWNPR